MMTFCTYPDLSLRSDDPAMPDRTEQIGRLLQRAERLLEDVENAPGDTPDARTARRAHELRETVGVLLILTERLARKHGNDPMVEPDARTGRACYTVELDNLDSLPGS